MCIRDRDYIDPKKITYLPNTAGCFTSKEALRTLRLAREIGGWKLVKLEVLGDKKTLFPDMIETLKSTEVLSKEGFEVMVYCTDDPLMAKRLENCGASAIMPLAAPIGSGLGIQNQTNIKIIRSQTNLPLIIDAGLGQASDATVAMELGCEVGYMSSLISPHVKSLDIIEGSPSFIEEASKRKLKNVVFHNMLFEQVNKENHYDYIFASHVIEHLTDPVDTLKIMNKANLKR